MRIDCPSGLVIEARPWSLGDMGEMAIRAAQPNVGEELLVDAVARQHVTTVDPGPYNFVLPGAAKPDWMKVLKVDVLWALYRLRAGSFPDDPETGLTGDDYTFDYRCPDTACDGHKVVSVQRVKLSELKTRKLPAASFAVVKSGASFETTVAGKRIKFVLPSFAIDAPLREHLKRERKKTSNPRRMTTPAENLAAQIVDIEDVKAADRDLAARATWLGALTAPEWVPLRDAITKAAPSLDNKIDVSCDACGRTTTIGLPLSPGFFVPEERMEEPQDQDGSQEEETPETPPAATQGTSPPSS
jgi:hypothetical protein